MGKLILFLLALPVVDLYLLVRLRHVVGGWPVLLVVLVSALIGVVIARIAGARELREWRQALAQGKAPGRSVIEGLLLLLACAWLILPGPISDVLGCLLLLRPVRARVSDRFAQGLREAVERGSLYVAVQQGMPRPSAGQERGARVPNVIDVEGEVVQNEAVNDAPRKRLSS